MKAIVCGGREYGDRIAVTDANFMTCVRAWRAMCRQRKRLHEMARKYPLILEFIGSRFVLNGTDEVDSLTEALRGKLAAHWDLEVPVEGSEEK